MAGYINSSLEDVKVHIANKDFDGPIDLLAKLVSESEIDIMDIFMLFFVGVGLSMDAFSLALIYGTIGAHAASRNPRTIKELRLDIFNLLFSLLVIYTSFVIYDYISSYIQKIC